MLFFVSCIDFDLYLVRPGRDDIVLNPSREIADYGVMKNEPMVLLWHQIVLLLNIIESKYLTFYK